MVRCTIHLENNPNAVYFAGQLLKGTVEMYLDHPKKFRGLCLIVYGAAYCHWTETRTRTSGSGKNRRTHNETVHFEGKDVYLNSRTYLFGRDGGDSMEVQAGTHRYEFACQLPPFIPASFEAKLGHIRYNVEASLDVPWGFDKEFKLQFTIVRHDDLNLFPQLKVPSKGEEFRKFCCLFCQSEPLMMTASIPFSGYAPGQTIKIYIDYVNKSDVEVERTKINLKRVVAYTSHTPHTKTRFESEKMVETFTGGVKSSSQNSYQIDLQIPSILLCSNGQFCNVVKLSYELKVEGYVGGCHRNIEIKFPITIGSTPLLFDQAPLEMSQQFGPSAPTAFGNEMSPNGYVPVPMPVDLPPPSFDEAVNMAKPETFKEKNGQLNNLGWNVQQTPEMPSAPADN